MSKNKNGTTPAPHSGDLVVVEVIAKNAIHVERPDHLEDGRPYKTGDTFTTNRGHAQAQSHALRILSTVRYRNDPNPEARYEDSATPAAENIGTRALG